MWGMSYRVGSVGVTCAGVGEAVGADGGRVTIWPTSARPIATTSKAKTPPVRRAETTRQVGAQPARVFRSSKARTTPAATGG